MSDRTVPALMTVLVFVALSAVALAQGDPPIYCQAVPVGEGIVFNPFNPSHEEMRIAGDRVRQELLKQ